MASARRVAAANGLTLDEGASSGTALSFKKSVKLWSWGSTITMDFDQTGPTETRVTVATKETFALSDWGRGQRLIRTILDGLATGPA